MVLAKERPWAEHLTVAIYEPLPTKSLKHWINNSIKWSHQALEFQALTCSTHHSEQQKPHHERGVACEHGPISQLQLKSIKCNTKLSYSQICIALEAVVLNTP